MSKPDIHSLNKNANELQAQGKWSDAEQILIQIKMLNPTDDKTYVKLGLLYQYEINDLLRAEQYYINATTINPSNTFAWFNLAKLYHNQNRYYKSHQLFERILSSDITATKNFSLLDVYYHFGELLLSLNAPKKALKYFDRLHIINPNNVDYLIQNAKTSAILTFYNTANQFFHNAFNLDPTNIRCKYEYLIFQHNKIHKYGPEVYLSMHSPYKYDTKHLANLSSVRHIIKRRSELLVSGYISFTIPPEIEAMCYQFLIGNCLINMDKMMDLKVSKFGLNEIIKRFFDVLCPGSNQATSIFSITKIIHFLQHVSNVNVTQCYVGVLTSIMDITNIYDILSIIPCTEKYIDILLRISVKYLLRIQWNTRARIEDIPWIALVAKLFFTEYTPCELQRNLLPYIREYFVNLMKSKLSRNTN